MGDIARCPHDEIVAAGNGCASQEEPIGSLSAGDGGIADGAEELCACCLDYVFPMSRLPLLTYDASDPHSIDHDFGNFLPRLHDGVAGMRIGLPRNFFFDGIDADIEAAVRTAASQFEALGAELVEVDLPGAEETYLHASVLIYCDAALGTPKR